MEICTTGFARKTAAQFFGDLKKSKVRRLLDVRLNNSSQLAGFTKRDDLRFFLQELCDIEYFHWPLLAPTQGLLDSYKKEGMSWQEYEHQFVSLMAQRQIESVLDRGFFQERTVLLCSENSAACCHRRLVLEYLNTKWGNVHITHL